MRAMVYLNAFLLQHYYFFSSIGAVKETTHRKERKACKEQTLENAEGAEQIRDLSDCISHTKW